MQGKSYRIYLNLVLAMLLFVGCGNTTETVQNEVKTEVVEEQSETLKDTSLEPNDEDEDDTKKGSEDMGVVEVFEPTEIECTGALIRLYVVFDVSDDAGLDDEIAKLDKVLSSDSSYEVRRKDETGNAVVISLTDTSLELLKKVSSISRYEIMEEAQTTGGTVSQ